MDSTVEKLLYDIKFAVKNMSDDNREATLNTINSLCGEIQSKYNKVNIELNSIKNNDSITKATKNINRLKQGINYKNSIKNEDIKELKDKGYSIYKIAKELNCSRGTIENRLKKMDNNEINDTDIIDF